MYTPTDAEISQRNIHERRPTTKLSSETSEHTAILPEITINQHCSAIPVGCLPRIAVSRTCRRNFLSLVPMPVSVAWCRVVFHLMFSYRYDPHPYLSRACFPSSLADDDFAVFSTTPCCLFEHAIRSISRFIQPPSASVFLSADRSSREKGAKGERAILKSTNWH